MIPSGIEMPFEYYRAITDFLDVAGLYYAIVVPYKIYLL